MHSLKTPMLKIIDEKSNYIKPFQFIALLYLKSTEEYRNKLIHKLFCFAFYVAFLSLIKSLKTCSEKSGDRSGNSKGYFHMHRQLGY